MRALILLVLITRWAFGNTQTVIPTGSCGINKYGTRDTPEPFIVGGTTAMPHAWPWQVSLETSTGHTCGGSIISSNFILTAAHCFGRNPYDYQWTVVVGRYSLSSTEPNEKRYSVARIVKHEFYSAVMSSANDVALIKVSTPISMNEDVQAVCLSQAGTGDLVGSMATVTGWGALSEGGSVSSTLMQVQVPVITNTQCQESYPREKILPGMVCAGYAQGGKDACQGDSGGPFAVKTAGKWIQVGIVSWGYGCAAPNQPGVYTRVSSYIDWIKKNAV